METKDELKEIGTKNPPSFYFDDTIKTRDSNNIFLYKKNI